MPMFDNKKRSEAMMERANEMQVGAARRENLKEAVVEARKKRKQQNPGNYQRNANNPMRAGQ